MAAAASSSFTEPATSPVPVVRRPHPDGARGAKRSLEACAERVRADYTDPFVVAFARRTLAEKGVPKGARAKAAVFLSLFGPRPGSRVKYILDPSNVEYIASARHLLCLDSQNKDLCHAAGDCDELAAAFCSLCMAVGIDCVLVGAAYSRDSKVPVHVLAAIFDPSTEQWYRCDPCSQFGVGQAHPATSEVEVDPLTGKVPDFSGPNPPASFVGVGGFPLFPQPAPYRYALGTLGAALAPRVLGAPAPPPNPPPPVPPVKPPPAPPPNFGFITPGDVFAYRTAWNDYVLDTARAVYLCASEYLQIADNIQKAYPQDAAAFRAYGQALNKAADAVVSDWNLWANSGADFIVLEAGAILQSFQKTVLQAGDLRAQITNGPTLTVNGVPHSVGCQLVYIGYDDQGNEHVYQAAPTLDPNTQAQIIARIEGFGILAQGVLEILLETANKGLQTAGSAAQWLGQQGKKLVEQSTGLTAFLLNPWTIGIAGLLIVGTVIYVVYRSEDVAKLATAVRPTPI